MRTTHKDRHTSRALMLIFAASAAFLALAPKAEADQGGIPFWLSGQMASLTATPPSSGFSLVLLPYTFTGSASGSKSFQIGNQIVAGVKATVDLLVFQPGYAPSEPILGGQARVALGWGPGYNKTSAAVALSNTPLAPSMTDSVTGSTDLYPFVSLSWNRGTSNWMAYATGDIPVGSYNSKSLANVGIGHGAADFGGGYTYFDPTSGRELSAVVGFTFNTENSSTHYTNGIDSHLDWAASQMLSANWQVGVTGYVYDQLSGDSGSGNLVGSFESKVASVGLEAGYVFAVANRPAYLNLRGYYEFWAEHRVRGHALFATLSIPIGASSPVRPNSP